MRSSLRTVLFKPHVDLTTTLELALKTTVVPEKAANSAVTFTRSTVASLTDSSTLLRWNRAAGVRFSGARRVENVFANGANPSSEDMTIAGWTKSNAGMTKNALSIVQSTASSAQKVYLTVTIKAGSTIFMRVRVKAVTAQYAGIAITGSASSIAGVTLDTTSGLIVQTIASNGATLIDYGVSSSQNADGWLVVIKGTVNAADTSISPQLSIGNNSSYKPNNAYAGSGLEMGFTKMCCTADPGTPVGFPEYVSVAVLAAPYQGTNNDGVQFYTYANGNTLSSNVAAEASGTTITASNILGALIEPARTNLCLQSQTLGTTWSATNITVANDQIAAPDGTVTAESLTASAGNGTLLQTITSTSADRVFSIWIQRKTGSGNIDVTLDGGTTWATQAVTGSWVRFSVFQSAVTNPSIGIRIVTNADAVYAGGGQLESAPISSSDIVTTTGSLARSADVLSYQVSSNLSVNSASIYMEYSAVNTITSTIFLFGSNVSSSNYTAILYDGTNFIMRKRISSVNYDAIVKSTVVSGTTYKIAVSWGTKGLNISVNGASGFANGISSPAQLAATFQVGADGAGANQSLGMIGNIKLYANTLSLKSLVTLTF